MVFGAQSDIVISGAQATLGGETIVDGNVSIRAACVVSGTMTVDGLLKADKV